MIMTTEDCKSFLMQHFPNTKTTEWKRMRKYNDQNMVVCEFSHLNHPPIFVYEYNGQLSLQKPQVTTIPSELSFFMFKHNSSDSHYIVGFSRADDDEVAFLITPLIAQLQELEEQSDSYYMCNHNDALQLYLKLTSLGMRYTTAGINRYYVIFDPNQFTALASSRNNVTRKPLSFPGPRGNYIVCSCGFRNKSYIPGPQITRCTCSCANNPN